MGSQNLGGFLLPPRRRQQLLSKIFRVLKETLDLFFEVEEKIDLALQTRLECWIWWLGPPISKARLKGLALRDVRPTKKSDLDTKPQLNRLPPAAAYLLLLPAAVINYDGARPSAEFRACPEGRGNSRP